MDIVYNCIINFLQDQKCIVILTYNIAYCLEKSDKVLKKCHMKKEEYKIVIEF